MNILEVVEKVGQEADWRNGEGWASVARHSAGFEVCWNPWGQHLTVVGPVSRFWGLRPDLFPPSPPKMSNGWLDIEPVLRLQKERLTRGKALRPMLHLDEVWKWSDVGTVLVAAHLEVPTEGWEPACFSGHEWAWREWGLESFGTFRATVLCKNCHCKRVGAPLAMSPKEAEIFRKIHA